MWASTPAVVPEAARGQDLAPRALGAFIHGAPRDLGALERFEAMVLRTPAIVMWFEAWGSSDAVTGKTLSLDPLHVVAGRGAVPMITWEPWDPVAGTDQPAYRLEHITRGDFDAYINAWAYRLAAYGGPVWLRFAHEMNASWYPWGVHVNHNTPEAYVAAWIHLRELFAAAGASNVRWVWCVDATARDSADTTAAYPGDDHVDWVALDGYNWGTSLPNSWWRGMREIFEGTYHELAARTTRPMMIAEMGCAEHGGNKAEWISTAFGEIPVHLPRIVAACWFNNAGEAADWRIESSAGAVEAFRSVAATPQWQGLLSPEPPTG